MNCDTALFTSKEICKSSANSEKPNYRPKHRTNNGTHCQPYRAKSFLKTNCSSAAKEISCILRDHKNNYHIDNSLQLVPVLKKETPEPVHIFLFLKTHFNPLNPELNPMCCLLALLGAHHFLHVSRIRVNSSTFRRLMSYIYGAPILDVSRSHTTTQHSR